MLYMAPGCSNVRVLRVGDALGTSSVRFLRVWGRPGTSIICVLRIRDGLGALNERVLRVWEQMGAGLYVFCVSETAWT